MISLNKIEVVEIVSEAQSGKDAKRPILQDTLRRAKADKGSIILVAKLDRLSRSVADIAVWMREGVRFVVARMGMNADNFMLHIRASFAELEREETSRRVSAALKQAKKRGVRLGTHNEKVMAGRKRQGSATVERVCEVIKAAQQQGITSQRKIAAYLNQKEILSPRGGKWTQPSIRLVLQRMNA